MEKPFITFKRKETKINASKKKRKENEIKAQRNT